MLTKRFVSIVLAAAFFSGGTVSIRAQDAGALLDLLVRKKIITDQEADSRVNMQGIAVQAGYALSDAVAFNITYGYGWRSDTALGTGGAPVDIGINPLDRYQIFQADLNVRF